VTACQSEEVRPITANESTLLGKLRGAASLQPTASSALELLTGSWDQPTGLFGRRTQPPRPKKDPTNHGQRKKKTLYLDEQAEEDLHFLLGELGRELGDVTRSEGVRRALRATRLATERQRSRES